MRDARRCRGVARRRGTSGICSKNELESIGRAGIADPLIEIDDRDVNSCASCGSPQPRRDDARGSRRQPAPQHFQVHHRLTSYRAGRRMDFGHASPTFSPKPSRPRSAVRPRTALSRRTAPPGDALASRDLSGPMGQEVHNLTTALEPNRVLRAARSRPPSDTKGCTPRSRGRSAP